MPISQIRTFPSDSRKPLIIGTIHQPAALEAARRLPTGALDLLEWRADHFPAETPPASLPCPWILTVRDAAEGGNPQLSDPDRHALFLRHLPNATAVDLEIRNASKLAPIQAAAAARSLPVIASFHDFDRTPETAALLEVIAKAQSLQPTVVKIACRLNHRDDLSKLASLLLQPGLPPLALMGMGPLGKASRLALALLGSCLNYGYLGEAQLEGQWHALRFAELLREAMPDLT